MADHIQTLSVEAQKEVLSELVTLADRCREFIDVMDKAGWNAILPRLNFETSFGEGEVLSEYLQYIIESAKTRIASPNIRFRLPEGKPYDSEFLRELRLRRDREIADHFRSTEAPIWAKKLTVCVRRMERLRHSQRAEFESKLKSVKEEEQQRRIYEVARHASGISAMFDNELDKPARFYRAIVEREFRPMGFTYNDARSNNGYVVFSKPFVAGWELCLTPEPLAWYRGRKEGEVRIVLTLQSEQHRKKIRSAKWDQVLTIEYAALVPNFDFCYRIFSSLDELEIIVMARAFLLSLAIDEIEARLVGGLAKVL